MRALALSLSLLGLSLTTLAWREFVNLSGSIAFGETPSAMAAEDAAPSPAGSEPKAPEPAADDKQTSSEAVRFEIVSLRGRVVWLSDGLEKLHGLRMDADARRTVAALQTADGRLFPILKDQRGRGFQMDPRLRDIEMELLVRQYRDVPLIQVLNVYTVRDGQKFELDYWCDICAIPMYELKECECCQGPIRLRERELAK